MKFGVNRRREGSALALYAAFADINTRKADLYI